MYFIAHLLPPHPAEKIDRIKRQFAERFGCRVALKSPSHITFIPPFHAPAAIEEKLCNWLDAFAAQRSSFPMATEGFSSFPPRTIFIKPAHNEELHALKASLDGTLHNDAAKAFRDFGMKTDSRPFHPHITIATRDLGREAYAEAWPQFQSLPFDEHWTFENLAILKLGQKKWDVLHTSQLQKNLC